MKERPIIFSGPMVRAILDGRKSQTRRVIKPQPKELPTGNLAYWKSDGIGFSNLGPDALLHYCPYGQPGDRLWVRETHYLWGRSVRNGKTKTGKQAWRFKRSGRAVRFEKNDFEEFSKGRETRHNGWIKRPSIHMPRWASRITLEIVSVRVERVREISEKDAKAEGVADRHDDFHSSIQSSIENHFIRSFAVLWDSINAKRGFGWDANPWCWALEFKRV